MAGFTQPALTSSTSSGVDHDIATSGSRSPPPSVVVGSAVSLLPIWLSYITLPVVLSQILMRNRSVPPPRFPHFRSALSARARRRWVRELEAFYSAGPNTADRKEDRDWQALAALAFQRDD